MNHTAAAATVIHRPFLATAYEPVGPWSASECKWINRVARELIKLGAASEQRLARRCRLDLTTVIWALGWLEAKQGGGLWYLPGDPV